jgi:hypothetical protein
LKGVHLKKTHWISEGKALNGLLQKSSFTFLDLLANSPVLFLKCEKQTSGTSIYTILNSRIPFAFYLRESLQEPFVILMSQLSEKV